LLSLLSCQNRFNIFSYCNCYHYQSIKLSLLLMLLLIKNNLNVLIHHPSLPSSFLHSSFPSSFHSSFLFYLNMLMIHFVLVSFSICIASLLPSISSLLCHMHFTSAHVLCFLMPFKLNSTYLGCDMQHVATSLQHVPPPFPLLFLFSSLPILPLPYSLRCVPSSSILSSSHTLCPLTNLKVNFNFNLRS
jgi:hypothetical protein